MHPLMIIIIFVVLTLLSFHAVVKAEEKQAFSVVHVFALLLFVVFAAWAWFHIQWLLIVMVSCVLFMYLFTFVDMKKWMHDCLMNFNRRAIDETDVELREKEGR